MAEPADGHTRDHGTEDERTPSPEEELERALDAAYRYLGRRDRTEVEVRQQLEQAGTTGPVLEQAIAILIDQRVLDDARYARLFVEDKRALDQWGADRIRRGLLTRGIERELIEEALSADESGDADGAHGGGSELQRAVDLLRTRFPSPPRERRERDRALGVMLRKGYDSEVAIDALAAYAREPATN